VDDFEQVAPRREKWRASSLHDCVRRADGEAVIEITVRCADDFWHSADLLQVPANYGSYRIFRRILPKRRGDRQKSCASLTQRLNPQNLIVLWITC
jgi:hypothetical protein